MKTSEFKKLVNLLREEENKAAIPPVSDTNSADNKTYTTDDLRKNLISKIKELPNIASELNSKEKEYIIKIFDSIMRKSSQKGVDRSTYLKRVLDTFEKSTQK